MNPALIVTRRQKIVREVKDYLLIGLGMVMYGIGWTGFLLPSDIPSGAVPGIASIIYWGTGFPVQYTYLIINFLLLLLALKILGLKFCLKTIFAVFTLTGILAVIQNIVTGPLIHDQPFMSCVLGASFCGAGIGVAFTANGSTGGDGHHCGHSQQIPRCDFRKDGDVLRYHHHIFFIHDSRLHHTESGVRLYHACHSGFCARFCSEQGAPVGAVPHLFGRV